MHRTSMDRLAIATLVVLGLLAASCGGGHSSSGGGGNGGAGTSLKIASPANGASVSEPFTLTFDASVPLGATSTGDDHVHVCFDGASCDSGNSYKIAYGDSYQVTGLPAGKHTIEASLRHADHSAVGANTTITVTITSAGSGTTGGTSSGGGGGGGGY